MVKVQPIEDQQGLLRELEALRARNAELQSRGDDPFAFMIPGELYRIEDGPLTGRTAVFLGRARRTRAKALLIPDAREIELSLSPDDPAKRHRGRTVSLSAVRVPENISKDLVIAFGSITAEVARYLARYPTLLYEVEPRRFEELIAAVLKDMGFDVKLTARSADGGRDVLAALRLPVGQILTIVECKRYARERRIGPDIVQRLPWIADQRDRASCAMIATTSSFTAGARELEQQYRWKLSLADFDDVCSWLTRYGTWRQNQASGLWTPTDQTDKR